MLDHGHVWWPSSTVLYCTYIEFPEYKINFELIVCHVIFKNFVQKLKIHFHKKQYFNLLNFISGFNWTIKNDICKTLTLSFYQNEIF